MPEEQPHLEADESAIAPASRTRLISLKNLFLDPNNYRFIDHKDYVPVPEDKIADDDVQIRTRNFLLEGTEGIRDLLASVKMNGWLPVDSIQVRQLSKGKWLVVEGNRRVATLKYLQDRYNTDRIDLGKLPPEFFSSIPVVVHQESDQAQHLILMGLAHIGGKKKWPPLNQARAIHSLIEKHGWDEKDASQALGIPKLQLKRSLSALALWEAFEASDYGDNLKTSMFSVFVEIVKNPSVRAWIGWNDTTYVANNQENLRRLFSWMSPDSSSEETDEGDEEVPPPEPAITLSRDIRELAGIINDENALRQLDETRTLSEATFASNALAEDRLSDSLSRIGSSLEILFKYSAQLTADHLTEAGVAVDKLKGILAARNKHVDVLSGSSQSTPFNATRHGHFSEISIKSYRRFRDLRIEGLRRVNIIVGANNAGKTSVLEAVQLLIGQNDITTLLDVVRRRGKVHEAPPPKWVLAQIPEESLISGLFDNVPGNQASVTIAREVNGEDLEDKAFYLQTIEIHARYGDFQQTSTTHLFEEKRQRQTKYDKCQVLCPVAFSSPFSQHSMSVLTDLFNTSVSKGTKADVVAFIRKSIDPDFVDVDQNTEFGPSFPRFMVEHTTLVPPYDITRFGEGLQRIFNIGLQFASAQNGVVLIDEFENAIHFELLVPFAKLVHDLAVKFNVQVFLTTHSKECVDAFARNAETLTEVAAYTLACEANEQKVYRYAGQQLSSLLESVNIDVRH